MALLGCSCSGKITFAIKLHEKLDGLTKLDSWIIDGDYSRTYEKRIVACDTIFFLDYSEDVCMDGIAGRVGQKRPDMPWTEDELDPELIELVRNYGKENTIVGVKRPFNSETSYQEIPKFWDEWLAQGEDRSIKGTFGVCLDMRGKDFDYWIADLYFPWEDIPEGCETRVIPGSYWAQFPCKMSNLQDVNTKIWSEWLPALQGYKLMGEYDIEVYLPPEEGSEETSVYIWVPLKKD